MASLVQERPKRPCHDATAGRADEGGKGKTSRMINAVQPSSIDALGGGRARRGGGPHGLAQQGDLGRAKIPRLRSKDTTP